jgi:hypothetical protein
MNGKYKAFYFNDIERFEELNKTVADCVKLTKENLNKIYPSNKQNYRMTIIIFSPVINNL